jgi:hypothetical protein
MSEHQRRARQPRDEMLIELSRRLTDEGKLIEAGWIGLRLAAVDPGASEDQIREMRMSFFAGAQHLFSSMMSVMDADAEPTEKDMQRISLIDAELREFIADFEMRHVKTEGNA